MSFGRLAFCPGTVWKSVSKFRSVKMEQGCAELLLILSTLYILMWRETSSHHLCFLREKTRSGEACTGTMRRFTPNIARYLGTDTNTWACNVHSKRKREANGFSVCPLPVHCKDLHNQNIPERLIAIFDRIGESIHGYRRCLRWCNRCYQTADKHLNNLPDYQPLKKVFFIPFFKMKDTLNYAYPRYKFSWELFFTLFREHIPAVP